MAPITLEGCLDACFFGSFTSLSYLMHAFWVPSFIVFSPLVGSFQCPSLTLCAQRSLDSSLLLIHFYSEWSAEVTVLPTRALSLASGQGARRRQPTPATFPAHTKKNVCFVGNWMDGLARLLASQNFCLTQPGKPNSVRWPGGEAAMLTHSRSFQPPPTTWKAAWRTFVYTDWLRLVLQSRSLRLALAKVCKSFFWLAGFGTRCPIGASSKHKGVLSLKLKAGDETCHRTMSRGSRQSQLCGVQFSCTAPVCWPPAWLLIIRRCMLPTCVCAKHQPRYLSFPLSLLWAELAPIFLTALLFAFCVVLKLG